MINKEATEATVIFTVSFFHKCLRLTLKSINQTWALGPSMWWRRIKEKITFSSLHCEHNTSLESNKEEMESLTGYKAKINTLMKKLIHIPSTDSVYKM